MTIKMNVKFHHLLILTNLFLILTFSYCNKQGYIEKLKEIQEYKKNSILFMPPKSIIFEDKDSREGFIEGNISITIPVNELNVKDYQIFWGSSASSKLSDTPVATINKIGTNLVYSISANTQAPSGTTHILVNSRKTTGEISELVSTTLQDAVGWQSLSNLPVNVSDYTHTLANSDTRVYLINYISKSVHHANINSDGTIGTWSSLSNSLSLAMNRANAIFYNNRIYITDYTRSYTGTITSTIDWVEGVGRDSGTCLVKGENNLYSLSGNSGAIAAYVASFDGTFKLSSWSALTNLTVQAVGEQCDTSAQILSFVSKQGNISAFQEKPLAANLKYVESVMLNGILYSIGGFSATEQGAVDTIYYSSLKNSLYEPWKTTSSKLPVAKNHHKAFTANGFIYVVGGCADDWKPTPNCTITNTVYYARPSASGNIP